MVEDVNTSIPMFKKIDRSVFDRIDKFKLTPGYNNLQDFYNGLEEEQQKLFKAAVILLIFLLPTMVLGLVYWQNNTLKADLATRQALITKANEIIGQNQGLREIFPAVLSQNPIDGQDMMSSRMSNMLSAAGIELSKIQVKNYNGEMISPVVMKSEADFAFSNITNDELMNIFVNMIQREKFRIQSVDIKRNNDTGLLQGQFHAIHFSNAQNTEEEE
ncbi:hypothetical protein [Peredibacter starrii]|uniref:Uncharacterized protein n=1 Tax=Peredibacter starrii TaxID=28202 RepID=A0AAX4HL68_9BACT|nr:hypothetical protein [Peredibacter starrii]WPU64018.1 hypothetical protein SOO65_15080 [Peredibacter starrii]